MLVDAVEHAQKAVAALTAARGAGFAPLVIALAARALIERDLSRALRTLHC
jgi:hypothetical protein